MAGRPQLPLGTAGEVSASALDKDAPDKGFIARCNYRGYDGVVRRISRTGKSKSAARAALNLAVRDLQKQAGVGGETTEYTTVADLAEVFWTQAKDGLSPTTQRLYRSRLDKIVIPAVGRLRIHEFTPGVQDRHYRAVAEAKGVPTAKVVRALLSNMNKIAVRDGAMSHNPVREMSKIVSRQAKSEKPALTIDQWLDLREKLAVDERALRMDVPFLVDGLMVTGLRISEIIAIEWEDLDLEMATLQVGAKMMRREPGVGLYIERDKTSSKLNRRELHLPSWFIAEAEEREPQHGVLFPSPDGHLRDGSNTTREVKKACTRAGYPWITPHTFRRSLATIMDDAGLPLSRLQEQLGQSSRQTTERYIKRRQGDTGARALLEEISGRRATS